MGGVGPTARACHILYDPELSRALEWALSSNHPFDWTPFQSVEDAVVYTAKELTFLENDLDIFKPGWPLYGFQN